MRVAFRKAPRGRRGSANPATVALQAGFDAAAEGEQPVARRSRRKPSFIESLSAVFLAGVTLLALVLTLGLGVEPTDAVRLAVVGAAAMLSVSVLSMAATMAGDMMFGGARSRTRSGRSRSSSRSGARSKSKSGSRSTTSRKRTQTRVPRGLVRRIDRRAGKLIRKHRDVLARKRQQACHHHEYGCVDHAKWKREQDTFIDTVILEGVSDSNRTALKRRARLVNAWRRRIDAAASEAERSRADAGVGMDFRPGMDGSEYEAYCGRILAEAGWKVWNKGDSGDQGVDLVAERDGVTVAIQCKRYRSSVGNSAVQEIYAGKATVSASAMAAVVTNAPYTRSAKELAGVTGVFLLHHDELPQLDDIVSGSGPVLAAAA